MDTSRITSTVLHGATTPPSATTETPGVRKLQPVLDDTVAFVRAYVVLSAEQADALALWVAHTYAIEAAETTPYIQITSAEKRSGKSRLLEVLELLVARPLFAVNISKAALFRSIEHDKPTLLLDEYDAIFGPLARPDEDLRGLLNAGHRRLAKVVRCEGPSMQPREWSVFCAKALAGIGPLPDTIADRSIPIVLQRKRPGEEAERFRRRDAEPVAKALRERLDKHVGPLALLKLANPDLPDGLDDRAADGWEPLLAIADRAKGEWPERARRAALALSVGTERSESSAGVELLAAIRKVFDLIDVDELPSRELIQALAMLDESPYDSWWDSYTDAPAKGVSARLARQLKPYGIHSSDIRFGDGVRKGYRRQDFQDAWDRHLALESAAADTAEVVDDLGVAAHTSTLSVREAPSSVGLPVPFSPSEGAR